MCVLMLFVFICVTQYHNYIDDDDEDDNYDFFFSSSFLINMLNGGRKMENISRNCVN